MACRRVIKVGERTVKNMIGESFVAGHGSSADKLPVHFYLFTSVVRVAVGACGRTGGGGNQSLPREKVIDVWGAMRSNVTLVEGGNIRT